MSSVHTITAIHTNDLTECVNAHVAKLRVPQAAQTGYLLTPADIDNSQSHLERGWDCKSELAYENRDFTTMCRRADLIATRQNDTNR